MKTSCSGNLISLQTSTRFHLSNISTTALSQQPLLNDIALRHIIHCRQIEIPDANCDRFDIQYARLEIAKSDLSQQQDAKRTVLTFIEKYGAGQPQACHDSKSNLFTLIDARKGVVAFRLNKQPLQTPREGTLIRPDDFLQWEKFIRCRA